MRRRINVTIDAANNTIIVAEPITIDDIRLIVDETQVKCICSSMQKKNVPVTPQDDGTTKVSFDTKICDMQEGDAITFDIDVADDAHADHQLILASLENIVQEVILYSKMLYNCRIEPNEDGINTFTVVLPLVAGIEDGSQTLTWSNVIYQDIVDQIAELKEKINNQKS